MEPLGYRRCGGGIKTLPHSWLMKAAELNHDTAQVKAEIVRYPLEACGWNDNEKGARE